MLWLSYVGHRLRRDIMAASADVYKFAGSGQTQHHFDLPVNFGEACCLQR